jgi:uncharacterized protein YbaR (Trm112 family)
MAKLDKRLLQILACPLSKAPVFLDGERLVSTDPETRRVYAIVDGFPNMLPNESTEMGPQEHRELLAKHGQQPYTSAKKG